MKVLIAILSAIGGALAMLVLGVPKVVRRKERKRLDEEEKQRRLERLNEDLKEQSPDELMNEWKGRYGDENRN